ncbi:MAG: hypothetical protein ACD_72C00204G0006 [uncultured bacterium]|nr:MAG: hypothetical protein ACD_72C00204G0006 [uncultured bacterium]
MKKKVLIYIILILVIIAVTLVATYYFIFGKNNVVWKNEALPAAPVFESVLDGTNVSSTELINPQVIGVMVDNHPDARPQSGLAQAKIVYEAPAEGGITRFLAIFDANQNIEKIGPVRSARPYFVDLLEEYSGMYMHCGGSPDGLQKIIDDKVFDLNEMYRGSYFWRDENKIAPHNLYTNSELWNKALEKNSSKLVSFSSGWQFGVLSTSTADPVQNIQILYSPDYAVSWTYDQNLKLYTRYLNDVPHTIDGTTLVADDVIVQYVKTRILDDYGRREMTTSGEGDLRLLRDGKMFKGVWKKINNRTRFYDATGSELNLKSGHIWIQLVPNDLQIKIST